MHDKTLTADLKALIRRHGKEEVARYLGIASDQLNRSVYKVESVIASNWFGTYDEAERWAQDLSNKTKLPLNISILKQVAEIKVTQTKEFVKWDNL